MPHREQQVADLAATIQRITDGESYIQRMEELLQRTEARGEDTSQVIQFLAEMRVLLESFRNSRDLLIRALDALDPKA